MSKRPEGPLGKALGVLSSFGLSCTLLAFLFVLTLLGTYEQVDHGLYAVQKRYFESWYVVHRFGPVPLLLPGGQLCMWVLAANIFAGGLVRIRKGWATAGVVTAHVGIVILLVAGLVKLRLAQDGYLQLYETQSSDEFVDWNRWEVAIWDATELEDVREHLIVDGDLRACAGPRGRTFHAEALPFELRLSHWHLNCDAVALHGHAGADSPAVEGWALRARAPEEKNEANLSGLYAVAVDGVTGAESAGILFPARFPWTFEAGGRTWAVNLRHRRYNMPFTIQLVDFMKVDHPGMTMAKEFKSDVVKIEGDSRQPVRIQMNEPLREGGVVLFQSDYGPKDGRPGPEYSVFSVVRNPSDQWPLYSCIVIGVGLLFAFVRKLYFHVLSQRRRFDGAQTLASDGRLGSTAEA